MKHPLSFSSYCCSNISSDTTLYTDQDIEASMEKIETVDFHAVGSKCLRYTHIPLSKS